MKLQEQFKEVWAERTANTSLLTTRLPASEAVDTQRFLDQDVGERLMSCKRTTTGADRLTNQHWKTVDPEGAFLAATFNVCLRFR